MTEPPMITKLTGDNMGFGAEYGNRIVLFESVAISLKAICANGDE